MKMNIEKQPSAWTKRMLYAMFVFCFEPKLFVKFPVMNFIFIAGLIASFAAMTFLYVYQKRRPTILIIMLVLYRLSFGLQTYFAHGDILMWGYMSIVLVTLCMLFEHYYSKYPEFVTGILVNVLAAMLTINLILGFIFPEGVFESVGFIGVRTRCTEVVITCLLLAMLSDHMKHKILSWRTLYVAIVSLITVVKFQIITAYLGIMIILAVFAWMLLVKNEKVRSLLNIWSIFIVTLLTNVLIVGVQITIRMTWLFENVFHRDPTISYRTGLWDLAFPLIKGKIFFGHGMAENGNFIPRITDGVVIHWQAHNQWLQLLYDGGIVTLLLFSALIVVCYFQMRKKTDTYVTICHMAGLTAFLLMMTVEIYSYTPYLFLLLFAAFFARTNHDSNAEASRKEFISPTVEREIRRARCFGVAPVFFRSICHVLRKDAFYRKKHEAVLKQLKKGLSSTIEECQQVPYNDVKIAPESPIWIFWYNGEENAPAIVRACIKSIRIHAGQHPVRVLNKENLHEFIDLPTQILKKVETGCISVVHFSDIIRVALLEKHGGIWCDATLFFLHELQTEIYDCPWYSIKRENGNETFASHEKWTAFFMASCPSGSIVTIVKKLLYAYWDKYDEMIDYFLIDYCISLACEISPSAALAIAAVPQTEGNVHWLMEHANSQYDDQVIKEVEVSLPFFKCSYKAERSTDANNCLNHYFPLED